METLRKQENEPSHQSDDRLPTGRGEQRLKYVVMLAALLTTGTLLFAYGEPIVNLVRSAVASIVEKDNNVFEQEGQMYHPKQHLPGN